MIAMLTRVAFELMSLELATTALATTGEVDGDVAGELRHIRNRIAAGSAETEREILHDLCACLAAIRRQLEGS